MCEREIQREKKREVEGERQRIWRDREREKARDRERGRQTERDRERERERERLTVCQNGHQFEMLFFSFFSEHMLLLMSLLRLQMMSKK